MRIKDPLPNGSRVHHRNCLWNRYFSEEERQARPSWGWGTLLQAVRQYDGSYEYEVKLDALLVEGGKDTSWWPSYFVDEASAPAVPFEKTQRPE